MFAFTYFFASNETGNKIRRTGRRENGKRDTGDLRQGDERLEIRDGQGEERK